MKKAIAVFAALVMAFACVLPAAAAPEADGFFTFNVYSGATYKTGYNTILAQTSDGVNTYTTIADITGYLLAGDTAIGEAYDDANKGKDYNWFYVYVVEEVSGGLYKVTDASIYETLGRTDGNFTGSGEQGKIEVPENGLIIALSASAEGGNVGLDIAVGKTIVAGDYVRLNNIDVDELASAEPRTADSGDFANDILKGASVTFYHDDGTGDVSEPSESVTDESTTDESTGTPETGDSVLVYAMIALIACAGAVVAVKVRK